MRAEPVVAAPPPRRLRRAASLLALGAALLVTLVVGVSAGATPIPAGDVWRITLNQVFPGWVEVDWTAAREKIVWELRAPRAILGALAGAGLAMGGAALQATTRNPLADPFLLGVSAGAALGAVAVIAHLGPFLGLYTLPVMAFAGGLLSLLLLLGALGRHGAAAPERVVLAGVAISFALMAATNLLIFLGDQRAAHSVVFWMLGGLGRATWDQLTLPTLAVLGGGAWLMLRARDLNALMMGEETAWALGVDASRTRLAVLAVTALMTSVTVALTGAIGFIGLVTPHVVRALAGGDNRRLLPLSALAGAILLVSVDIAARLVVAPQEAPVGVITGGIGGLFFLWLTGRRQRTEA